MKRNEVVTIKTEFNLVDRPIEEVNERKQYIVKRLHELNGQAESNGSKSGNIPIPPTPTLHWDYLLKEMAWLAGDFQRERLRHVNNGKKISKAIEIYHKTKDVKEVKKIKDDALALRRISSKLSRDVRKFWLKIDKVVAFKQKTDSDEVRQKAMDKHLVHLIKQTERYTSLLADNLKTGGTVGMDVSRKTITNGNTDPSSSASSSKSRSSRRFLQERPATFDADDGYNDDEMSSDEDFEVDTEESEDDETTLIEEEQIGRDMTIDEEITLLRQESEMSVDELRAKYASAELNDNDDIDYAENTTEMSDSIDGEDGLSDAKFEPSGDSDDDEDYVSNDSNAVDDETTLIEEETKDRDISVEDELKLLQDEGNMSVEQLRAMYAGMDDMSDEEVADEEEMESDNDAINHNQSSEDGEDDESYDGNQSSEDDETTLIEEEARDRDIPVDEEISCLKKESEMSIEELRAMYSNLPDYDEEEDSDVGSEEEEAAENSIVTSSHNICLGDSDEDVDEESDDDFMVDEADAEGVDDETTLIEEEMNGRDMTVDEELKLLQDEGDMSIEELRARYANMPDDSDDKDMVDDEDEDEEVEESIVVSRSKSTKSVKFQDSSDSTSKSNNHQPEDTDIDSDGDHHSSQDEDENLEGDDDVEEVDAALKRLQTADLEARSVHVERPFVLSNSLMLREYQHVGLNWLVSLHERRLNGILADEMGLGKTIQTISLLAYLAAYRGLWGPHLIVVPTSCIVNWESEFKKWCPIFKILTYYGGAKARKQLRSGWSKLNSFHICITSYQLVVQDATSFRRKRWYYMVLDEAHNIKNFKSQRWQTLLNFNTQRRLLLTGTPLQNNLMELWSLMHFLMPHIFRSRKEFSYWFSNPLNNMVEGNRNVNNDVISKLHGIMRPFLLRRLKKDVEKQLPGKHEHIVMCKLSKRQQYLYEEYMARTSTKASMNGGNYLGMMNILMQLRKVCNHPDLFEPRPITSPFIAETIYYHPSKRILKGLEKHPLDVLSSSFFQLWPYDEDLVATDAVYSSSTHIRELDFVSIEDVNLQISDAINQPHYRGYIQQWRQKLHDRHIHKMRFNYQLSTQRCNRPRINISWRTVQACTLTPLVTTRAVIARTNNRIARDLPLCWHDMIRTVDDRAAECDDMIRTFVFIIPKIVVNLPSYLSSSSHKSLTQSITVSKCGVHTTSIAHTTDINIVRRQAKQAMLPFYTASMRQKIFFPDRKLIQFDSGKLQTLNILLHDLKRGGHKCLIFTQMSKMLDILEIFLNLHGHTYVRLDGSTGVDRRQKLMDRYNSDPKLFCFILSTRSGGLGINLTGADTVIFYDSDWNPAMDAQAQDRAHRIGQTREVHIYRLVSASTVEENILIKAKQKRQLDFLVMTEGNFSEESLFTSRSLQDMLGVSDAQINTSYSSSTAGGGNGRVMDIEAAMTMVEDAEDVSALRLAEKEIETEQAEFDESAPVKSTENDDDEVDPTTSSSSNQLISTSSSSSTSKFSSDSTGNLVSDKEKDEKDMELEFATWQAKIGPDINALQQALRPVERYAFHLHTDIDPYYSIYYIQEQQRLSNMAEEERELNEQWDIDAIERDREEDEYRALSEGELLATNLSRDDAINLKSWFLKERSRMKRERRRRMMTGEGWEQVIDPVTRVPFWFNNDTGAASYAIPDIIHQKEVIETALARGFSAAPLNIMIHIFSYLSTYPDRMTASRVCARWKDAAIDPIFQLRVLPVESGARDSKIPIRSIDGTRSYASVEDALHHACAGDTIMLGSGHHWESSLIVDKPIRLIGDCDDPARCILELTGEMYISQEARSIVVSMMTIRRPRKIPKRVACLTANHASVELFKCMISNEGSQASSTIVATNGSSIQIFGSTIRGGSLTGISAFSSSLLIAMSKISQNQGDGLSLTDTDAFLDNCIITNNSKAGINLNSSSLLLSSCRISSNDGGSMLVDDMNESDSHIQCRDCLGDGDFMELMTQYRWHVDDPDDDGPENYMVSYTTAAAKTSSSSSSSATMRRHDDGRLNNHHPGNGETDMADSYFPSIVPSQHSKQAIILQSS